MDGEMNRDRALLQDMKLTVLRSMKLYPSFPPERRSMFLSNIDQMLNFSNEAVQFFAANGNFSPEKVVELLIPAVEAVLVPYNFLAGRLRMGEEEGRLEIDCNSAGVDFVVAESKLDLIQIGELEYINPAFRQLAIAGLPAEGVTIEDQSLFSFQVTSFQCGGFALGFSINHVTLDGISCGAFLKNLASLAGGSSVLPFPPFTDRRLLAAAAARSPPRVTFPDPELFDTSSLAIMSALFSAPLHCKLLHLPSSAVAALKRLALPLASRPSSFNVVVAHIWRCKLLAAAEQADAESQLLYAVDIRGRTMPPLPANYAGNAVLAACGEAAAAEVREGEFGRVVEAVTRGEERLRDDEHIWSMIDRGSLHHGFHRVDLIVLSWMKLGFSDVEYPWGRPIYSSPLPNPGRRLMLLCPAMTGGGVNVVAALPPEEMERFEEAFYRLLPGKVDK